MTSTFIIAIVCMLVHALIAYIGARNEAATVYDRMATGDRRDLDHGPLLLIRVVLTVFFIAGVLVFFGLHGVLHDLLTVIALVMISLGTHAIVHRLVFNHETNHHPCYLSPGNKYDTFYLRRTVDPWPMYLRKRYARFYQDSEKIRDQVHAAGRNAFAVESTTALIGFIIAAIIPYLP